MKKQIKNIAVLTSGGDCPGLNSALKAVVNRAHYEYKWKVYGILNSTEGFFHEQPKYKILKPKDFSFYETRIAGSLLGSSISMVSPFDHKVPDGSKGMLHAGPKDLTPLFKKAIDDLEIDALIVIGGDGSMGIVYHLCKMFDLPLIGIPKTIDNDTPLTETSIGYFSAVTVCTHALDSLITTAYSHKRWMILEVMGRHAGHIAIKAGIAGAADAIIIPEIKWSFKGIKNKILEVQKEEEREYGIVVIAEGACISNNEFTEEAGSISKQLAKKLSENKINARDTVLGHIQRGATPDAYDRFLATSFGVRAVDALAKGKKNQMMGYSKSAFVEFDIVDVVKEKTGNVKMNSDTIKTAQRMRIYIGEC